MVKGANSFYTFKKGIQRYVWDLKRKQSQNRLLFMVLHITNISKCTLDTHNSPSSIVSPSLEGSSVALVLLI